MNRTATLQAVRAIKASLIGFQKSALRKNQLKALMGKGKVFGILSAYRPVSKKQNQIAHGELTADLQRKGYRAETLKGQWEGVTERSVFVKNMKFADLVALGEKFNQDSVIFKSPQGVLAMYYLKTKKAVVSVDTDSLKPSLQVSLEKDLYSKARGLSFEIDFLWDLEIPWNGRTPVSIAEIEGYLAKQAA